MQKFLIIQTAFIGDVVLATPLIEKLHAFFPDAQIDFLLRKGNEKLLIGHPFIHDVLIWDKKKNKRRNLVALIQRIRKNHYDRVVNVQRFFATGLLTALSGGRETIGFDKNPLSVFFTRKIKHKVGGNNSIHETKRNLELIENFTDAAYFKPKLYPSISDFESTRELSDKKFITISPASVWFTKQFPVSQWIRFVETIPDHFKIYLLGGPDDQKLCTSIANALENKNIQILAGQLSFLQSAALMSKASMNYVNDSAPMHFASAMNAAVTAVYCSTIPEFGFGPTSDISHIVQIKESLYCRPCGLHGYMTCPEKHFRCAMDIQIDQLRQTLPV